MPLNSHRLLGFAFAGADLLLEVAPGGAIAFALGAAETLSGDVATALVGRGWREFIDPVDQPMIEALFDGLDPGRRAGPVRVRLADKPDGQRRAATLSAFRLPQNRGALSCCLSRATAEAASHDGRLIAREDFETLAMTLLDGARDAGGGLELAFIELAGLDAARQTASPEARGEMERKVAGVLRAQAHGGAAAARLGEDRYALVRPKGEAPGALTARLGRLMETGVGAGVTAQAQVMPLEGDGDPRQLVRALRYALDDFLRDGLDGERPASLSDALQSSIRRTLRDAGELGAAISGGAFRLVYQPVVRVADASLHHYETLVRFGDDESPFPQIRMAEEMNLIEPLDLAILKQALATLSKKPELKLAVNVSGRTVASAEFIAQAVAQIAAHPTARGRLMFELTESAALDDLAQADRHLGALRAQGCEICLDDFGAGAASLAYLQQLHLDVLKIDGRYIRDLQHGGREATFVKHLVKMCRELGIRTLAEMVETRAAEVAVREAGVDLAQGWLYGAAADTPQPPATTIQGVKAVMRPGLSR